MKDVWIELLEGPGHQRQIDFVEPLGERELGDECRAFDPRPDQRRNPAFIDHMGVDVGIGIARAELLYYLLSPPHADQPIMNYRNSHNVQPRLRSPETRLRHAPRRMQHFRVA